MSNGLYRIARVEIENGIVLVDERWGCYAPRDDLGWVLSLRFKNHDGRGDGNVVREPVETEVWVYLTRGQLDDLTRQLIEYAAQDLSEDGEVHPPAHTARSASPP